MAEGGTRAGFVAVLGAPNVGKSTLVNRLVGTKVAIVTPKVQTTRSRLRGIRVIDEVQLVFVDTPGIFAAKHRFERAMVHAAWSGASDAPRPAKTSAVMSRALTELPAEKTSMSAPASPCDGGGALLFEVVGHQACSNRPRPPPSLH